MKMLKKRRRRCVAGGMNSGKAYFENLLRHQQNVQQKGCAYYQVRKR
jgi:hypothetical protein